MASSPASWQQSVFNRRILICVFTGFASGMPLYVLLQLVPAWLRDEGVSLAEAEDALDATVAEFIETGVDPEQLDRIKLQLRASQIYAEDNIGGLARRYGEGLTSGLTIADIEAWPDVLQAVTGEQIVEAARNVLDRKQSVTGWLKAPDAMPAAAEEVSQ